MEDNDDVLHAGCVGTNPEADDAGCASESGERPMEATLQAEVDSAGCADTKPAGESNQRATPPQTVREFERALRTLGFSRLQAASIARRGFSGVTAPADSEPSESERLRAAIDRLARLTKG